MSTGTDIILEAASEPPRTLLQFAFFEQRDRQPSKQTYETHSTVLYMYRDNLRRINEYRYVETSLRRDNE